MALRRFLLAAVLAVLALAGPHLQAAPADTSDDKATPATAQSPSQSLPSAAISIPGAEANLLTPFQPYRQKMGDSAIDWSAKELVAVGRSEQEYGGSSGALMARRAAELLALRNAMAMAAGVRIGPEGRVENLPQGQVILEGCLKDYKIANVHSRTTRGQTYWYAEARVPLFGVSGLSARFYDAQIQSQVPSGVNRASWAPADASPRGDVLVIDARSCDFQMSMYPTLVSQDGRVLLDMQTASREVAINVGPCAAACTGLPFEKLKTAGLESGQAGPARILVKATAAQGAARTVLVVSDADAGRLLADPAAASAARGGRVVIVVKEPAFTHVAS